MYNAYIEILQDFPLRLHLVLNAIFSGNKIIYTPNLAEFSLILGDQLACGMESFLKVE
jgi:hypothetical protein